MTQIDLKSQEWTAFYVTFYGLIPEGKVLKHITKNVWVLKFSLNFSTKFCCSPICCQNPIWLTDICWAWQCKKSEDVLYSKNRTFSAIMVSSEIAENFFKIKTADAPLSIVKVLYLIVGDLFKLLLYH